MSPSECSSPAKRLRSSPPVHPSIHLRCIERFREPCDGCGRTWGSIFDLRSTSFGRKLGGNLKFRISLFALVLALAASSALTAHASACSNSTITGTYAFTLHGTVFLPNGATVLISGIAKQTYDGKGNVTQVDAVADNGFLTPGWRLGTGTYSVNSDCTGTLTIMVRGWPTCTCNSLSRNPETPSTK